MLRIRPDFGCNSNACVLCHGPKTLRLTIHDIPSLSIIHPSIHLSCSRAKVDHHLQLNESHDVPLSFATNWAHCGPNAKGPQRSLITTCRMVLTADGRGVHEAARRAVWMFDERCLTWVRPTRLRSSTSGVPPRVRMGHSVAWRATVVRRRVCAL